MALLILGIEHQFNEDWQIRNAFPFSSTYSDGPTIPDNGELVDKSEWTIH
jgi:long-subunit fatty acid transport protein